MLGNQAKTTGTVLLPLIACKMNNCKNKSGADENVLSICHLLDLSKKNQDSRLASKCLARMHRQFSDQKSHMWRVAAFVMQIVQIVLGCWIAGGDNGCHHFVMTLKWQDYFIYTFVKKLRWKQTTSVEWNIRVVVGFFFGHVCTDHCKFH